MLLFSVMGFLDYLHVDFRLETVLFDDYLYNEGGCYIEMDYAIVLFGPILKNASR